MTGLCRNLYECVLVFGEFVATISLSNFAIVIALIQYSNGSFQLYSRRGTTWASRRVVEPQTAFIALSRPYMPCGDELSGVAPEEIVDNKFTIEYSYGEILIV